MLFSSDLQPSKLVIFIAVKDPSDPIDATQMCLRQLAALTHLI
jgi:hypothetical protein